MVACGCESFQFGSGDWRLNVRTNTDLISFEILADQNGLSIWFSVNDDFKNCQPPILPAVVGLLFVLMQVDDSRSDFSKFEGLAVIDMQEH